MFRSTAMMIKRWLCDNFQLYTFPYFLFFILYLLLFHPKKNVILVIYSNGKHLVTFFAQKHNFSSSSGYHNANCHIKKKKNEWMEERINGKQNTWKNENPVQTIIKILHAKLHLKIKRIIFYCIHIDFFLCCDCQEIRFHMKKKKKISSSSNALDL